MHLSEVIVPDDRENQLENVLVSDEFGLGLFAVHFVLEVLDQVELLCLDHHLLVV